MESADKVDGKPDALENARPAWGRALRNLWWINFYHKALIAYSIRTATHGLYRKTAGLRLKKNIQSML
jgi:hypothetical protein